MGSVRIGRGLRWRWDRLDAYVHLDGWEETSTARCYSRFRRVLVGAWRDGVLFYLGNGVAFDGVWYEPISSDVPVPPLPIVEPFATTRAP